MASCSVTSSSLLLVYDDAVLRVALRRSPQRRLRGCSLTEARLSAAPVLECWRRVHRCRNLSYSEYLGGAGAHAASRSRVRHRGSAFFVYYNLIIESPDSEPRPSASPSTWQFIAVKCDCLMMSLPAHSRTGSPTRQGDLGLQAQEKAAAAAAHTLGRRRKEQDGLTGGARAAGARHDRDHQD